jgi:hypothetical protein
VSENTERAGLGKVIYNVDESKKAEKEPSDETVTNTEVQEASEESFPASDAPGYAGGTNAETTRSTEVPKDR